MVFGDVTNLWARRGAASPIFCFAGHTDVVPPGDVGDWKSDPFEPDIRGEHVYAGSIAFLITSDEEGRARDGTLKVIEALTDRGERIDWCVIGEPSSHTKLGDVVRIGRRGSLSGMLEVRGIQGHVAYPHLADNPIRRFAPVLAELHGIVWDEGNEFFPPTSFQVVNIQSGIGAPNVTPAQLSARFNFRYSTEWDHHRLKERVHAILDAHEIDYELRWHLSGEPFLTEPGRLINAVSRAVEEHIGQAPELSTGGGTSDGRFISPAGADVVELGPVSTSIHKVDEHVRMEDVGALSAMYQRILELMLGGASRA
jgi:succinyl-diaminopimelate desuccinylase